ncbi:DUF4190 domain-containing protein [Isoptericola aurantiacus]|uniref:DUF4190 domain-containing protein n=1 Tax=Isoptericola aurantiacus TaxID=3377839 RepID=UPI00383A2ED3
MTSPTPPPDPYQPPASPAAPAGVAPPVPPEPGSAPSPYAEPGAETPPGPYLGPPGQADPSNPYGLPQDPGTDGVSIAALVTGILTLGPVALGLGIAGVVRTRRSGRRGTGFAVTGIVLGTLSTLCWAGLIGLIAFAVNSDEFQESFQESFNDSYNDSMGLDMTVGQCFDTPEDLVGGEPMVPADCAEPHDSEVFAVQDFDDEQYPGDVAVQTRSRDLCMDAFAEYVGTPYADSELDFIYFYPTAPSWKLGDRQMLCSVTTLDGSPLTGSMAGAGI